jgi:hypothetical protein
VTLQKLLEIGHLKEHQATAAEVQRLLEAVGRNLQDAAAANISDETRFDAAYKAVMQCALVAMMVAGYRPATNEPGHHQTMIQSLPLTLGVSIDVWVVLKSGTRPQRFGARQRPDRHHPPNMPQARQAEETFMHDNAQPAGQPGPEANGGPEFCFVFRRAATGARR